MRLTTALCATLAMYALAGCMSARAQGNQPLQSSGEPIITIALPASQWNTVLQGLGELPLKLAFPLVQNIQAQAAAQMKPKDDPKEKDDGQKRSHERAQ